MPTGRPARLPPRISTKITATELSPTSRKNPASGGPAGRLGSVWATTTMTDGTICFAASGDTTSCFTTTATELSPTSPARPESTTINTAGEPVAPGSTTTATATSIFLSATT